MGLCHLGQISIESKVNHTKEILCNDSFLKKKKINWEQNVNAQFERHLPALIISVEMNHYTD